MNNPWMSVLAWALAVLIALALAVATPTESSLLPKSAQANPLVTSCLAAPMQALRPPHKCSSGDRVRRP